MSRPENDATQSKGQLTEEPPEAKIERERADRAIANGKDPKAVADLFEKRTGYKY